MDEQDITQQPQAAGTRPAGPSTQPASQTSGPAPRAPYRRPHVSQPPINDIDPEYVMPERYVSVDRAQPRTNANRRHMGVATSDPDYLPPTSGPGLRTRPQNGAHPATPRATSGEGTARRNLNYDRYLQTPKPGKSIFTSQHDRRRRRVQRILAVLMILAVALLLIWVIFLR